MKTMLLNDQWRRDIFDCFYKLIAENVYKHSGMCLESNTHSPLLSAYFRVFYTLKSSEDYYLHTYIYI